MEATVRIKQSILRECMRGDLKDSVLSGLAFQLVGCSSAKGI